MTKTADTTDKLISILQTRKWHLWDWIHEECTSMTSSQLYYHDVILEEDIFCATETDEVLFEVVIRICLETTNVSGTTSTSLTHRRLKIIYNELWKESVENLHGF